jgi:hypothetical protein
MFVSSPLSTYYNSDLQTAKGKKVYRKFIDKLYCAKYNGVKDKIVRWTYGTEI